MHLYFLPKRAGFARAASGANRIRHCVNSDIIHFLRTFYCSAGL